MGCNGKFWGDDDMELSVRDVVKRYGNRQVLRGISLDVPKGSITAILGPSGCGKTTLLHAIAGLVDIDDGKIIGNGEALSAPNFAVPPERRSMGMVFQNFALWPHMTVRENVAFGLSVRRWPRTDAERRVREVLAQVQMDGYGDRYPHQLSGGQQQRIAIARALAPRPDVLLMDEPLSSLDAKLREEMRWHLSEIVRKTGITTIYVTHDQTEALSMADRVAVLNQGWVQQVGAPADIYERPRNLFVANFVGVSNVLVGVLRERLGKLGCVRCGDAELWGILCDDIPVGNLVSWAVRPSRGSASAQAHSEHFKLRGTIVQCAYLGDRWRCRVNLHAVDGAFVYLDDVRPRQVGDTLDWSFPRDAAYIYAFQEDDFSIADRSEMALARA